MDSLQDEYIVNATLLKRTLKVKPSKQFYRIWLAIQQGFRFTVLEVYGFEEDDLFAAVEKVEIGEDVRAVVYDVLKGDEKGYSIVTKIEGLVHFRCPKCAVIKTIDENPDLCSGCLNKQQEKLSGRFKVTERKEIDGQGIKLFFEQDKIKLCLVTYPTKPFFEVLGQMEVDQTAFICGWRDEKRHSTLWNVTKCLKRSCPL